MARAATKSNTRTSTKPAAPPVTGSAADMADTGSMDKIRDILFGNQVKDFEIRFARMEENLAKETAELRSEAFKRVDAIEAYFKKEIGALKDRMKQEARDRNQAVKQLGKDIQMESGALAKRIETVADDLAEQATDLRGQLLDQSKSLSADIQTKYEQSNMEMTQACDALGTAKVDRAVLAEFLVDMAMRLSGQSQGESTGTTDT